MTAPSIGSTLSRYAAAPRAAGTPDRAADATGPAGATPRALIVALAAFLVINFARTHEMVALLGVGPIERIIIMLRLGKVIGVPLVIISVLRMPRDQFRAALRTQPGRGMLLIGSLMLTSIPLSIWRGNSIGYVTGTGLISYIMFVTTAAVLVDRSALPTVLRVAVIGVAAGALRMVLPGAPTFMEEGVPRVLFGYTYDPNDTAALFLATMPIALYLGGRRGARRVVWYLAALLMVIAIVRTGSRGGLLGLGAMLSALVVLAPPRQRSRLIGAGLAAALAFGTVVQSNPALRARFASTFESSEKDYNYTATNGRIELWKRGMHYMITHPVTGVGIANFTIAELKIGSDLKRQQGITDKHMFTAHNSLVQIGAELGIPGLCAYLFVMATAARALWRVRRRAVIAASAGWAGAEDEAALASTAITALVGVFAGGVFLSLAYSPMTLFTVALCAAVIAGAPLAIRSPVARAPGAAALQRPAGRRGGLWRAAAQHASALSAAR